MKSKVKKIKRKQMQSTWEIVKNKGLVGQLGAQSTIQLRDEGLMEASIFHSFLSSLVTQYKTFTFYIVNTKLQQYQEKEITEKKKKKKKKILDCILF